MISATHFRLCYHQFLGIFAEVLKILHEGALCPAIIIDHYSCYSLGIGQLFVPSLCHVRMFLCELFFPLLVFMVAGGKSLCTKDAHIIQNMIFVLQSISSCIHRYVHMNVYAYIHAYLCMCAIRYVCMYRKYNMYHVYLTFVQSLFQSNRNDSTFLPYVAKSDHFRGGISLQQGEDIFSSGVCYMRKSFNLLKWI